MKPSSIPFWKWKNKKKSPSGLFLNYAYQGDFLSDTVESDSLLGGELYLSVLHGEEGVIGGSLNVLAWVIMGPALADDDLSEHDLLAVLELDSKALRD